MMAMNLCRILILTALTVGSAAQRPQAQLHNNPGGPSQSNAIPANSDVESSLHDYLVTRAAGGAGKVPPRVMMSGNVSSGPTQVAVGLAVVSLHEIDVLSSVVEMSVWQRL